MTESVALAIGAPLVVGVLTALVSVQLALRRFRTEHWWHRRVEGYTSVLMALFDVQRSLRAEVRRLEEGTQL